jgi:hypothetical protein
MRDRPVPWTRLLGCALLGALCLPAAPRESAAQASVRLDTSVGPLWTDSQDDNCDPGLGLGAGVQLVRTSGLLSLGAALDLLTSLKVACKDGGNPVTFEGQSVDVFSTAGFLAPRLGVKAGLALELGALVAEPALAAGIMPMHTDFFGPGEWLWTRWYGAALHTRAPSLPVGLLIEWGWRELPVRYGRNGEMVHEFTQKVPMVRVVATF